MSADLGMKESGILGRKGKEVGKKKCSSWHEKVQSWARKSLAELGKKAKNSAELGKIECSTE